MCACVCVGVAVGRWMHFKIGFEDYVRIIMDKNKVLLYPAVLLVDAVILQEWI